MKLKLDWATRRFVEQELRFYPRLLQEWEELRGDIIECQQRAEVAVSGGQVGNPTEQKALRLITSPYLKRLEITVSAIQQALEQLDDEGRRLIELTYWTQGLSAAGIARRLFMDERTYRRKKVKCLEFIALHLGLIPW